MHAISQEPEPCIYAQLEACMSEEEQDETDEEELYPEIRLVPKDADKCTICFCSAQQACCHTVYVAPMSLTQLYCAQCRLYLRPCANALLSILTLKKVRV